MLTGLLSHQETVPFLDVDSGESFQIRAGDKLSLKIYDDAFQ
jgi:hypothetical protein